MLFLGLSSLSYPHLPLQQGEHGLGLPQELQGEHSEHNLLQVTMHYYSKPFSSTFFLVTQMEGDQTGLLGKKITTREQGAGPGRCSLWAAELGPPFQCPG